jgi:hypothetical protein
MSQIESAAAKGIFRLMTARGATRTLRRYFEASLTSKTDLSIASVELSNSLLRCLSEDEVLTKLHSPRRPRPLLRSGGYYTTDLLFYNSKRDFIQANVYGCL